MDKRMLEQFLQILPDDASEISIPRHDSDEILFNSDSINRQNSDKIGAVPAQKGTYRGTKRRWRLIWGTTLGLPDAVKAIDTEQLPSVE